MYNNAIDGVSASGDRFFYVNRLASAGDGRDLRWEHASLECCPPNLVRFLASMPGYIYAQDRSGADLRQPVRVERRVVRRRRHSASAVGRQRDAVGRTIDDHGWRRTSDVARDDQAAHSRVGAQSAGARRSLSLRGMRSIDTPTGVAVNGAACGGRAGQASAT